MRIFTKFNECYSCQSNAKYTIEEAERECFTYQSQTACIKEFVCYKAVEKNEDGGYVVSKNCGEKNVCTTLKNEKCDECDGNLCNQSSDEIKDPWEDYEGECYQCLEMLGYAKPTIEEAEKRCNEIRTKEKCQYDACSSFTTELKSGCYHAHKGCADPDMKCNFLKDMVESTGKGKLVSCKVCKGRLCNNDDSSRVKVSIKSGSNSVKFWYILMCLMMCLLLCVGMIDYQ